MYGRHKITEAGDMAVTAETELMTGRVALQRWRCDLHDNQSDATSGSRFVVGNKSITDMALVGAVASSHGRHHNSVPHLHLAYHAWFKELPKYP